jgi:hypothetical protein
MHLRGTVRRAQAPWSPRTAGSTAWAGSAHRSRPSPRSPASAPQLQELQAGLIEPVVQRRIRPVGPAQAVCIASHPSGSAPRRRFVVSVRSWAKDSTSSRNAAHHIRRNPLQRPFEGLHDLELHRSGQLGDLAPLDLDEGGRVRVGQGPEAASGTAAALQPDHGVGGVLQAPGHPVDAGGGGAVHPVDDGAGRRPG